MNLQDPISKIKGIGPARMEQFFQLSVRTVGDLLKFEGPAPKGVNLAEVQKSIKEQLGTTAVEPTLIQWITHNWYHLQAHVILEDHICKVRIDECLLMPYGCVLRVHYKRKGVWKHRMATPLYLASIHMLWTRSDIVSSDEDVDSVELLAKPYLPLFCFTALPAALGDEQMDQIQLTLREVQDFQTHNTLSLLKL